MASFDCDGDRLFYSVDGRGPAVVLLHSLGGSSAMWESLTAHLKSDFRVAAFDARGHGRSSAKVPFTMARYAQDALALMKHLGFAQFHVVGISMGGRAAVRVALARSDAVRSIIVADTGAGDGSGNPERIAGVRRRIDEIGSRAFALEYTRSRLMPDTPSDVVERYAADVVQTLPDAYLTTLTAILMEDLRPDLDKVRAPTLVVTGDHDVSAPPKTAKALADGIAGSRFEIIASANHFSNLDQPERFNTLVGDFLRQIEQSLPQRVPAS
jgi:3-oxoadipate enol-lactonase